MGAASKETVTARELDVSNRVAFYHFVAKLLRLWVPTNPTPHRAKTPKALKIRVLHDLEWLPFLHKWGCGKCLRIFKTRATSAKSTCSGLSQSAVKSVKAAQSHGHQLMVCNYLQSPGSFLFCNRCGCYSQVRVIGLGRTCLGRAGSQLHRLHRHIQSGKHPTTGALLGKPRFLPSGAFGHATGKGPSQLEEVPSQVRDRPVVLPLTQVPKVAHKWSTCGIWDEDFEFSPGDFPEPFELGDAWDEEP